MYIIPVILHTVKTDLTPSCNYRSAGHDIGTEVAVVNVREAQVLIPGVWTLQVQVKKVMNPVGIILYVMNTVLAVVNMREAQVLIPNIAT